MPTIRRNSIEADRKSAKGFLCKRTVNGDSFGLPFTVGVLFGVVIFGYFPFFLFLCYQILINQRRTSMKRIWFLIMGLSVVVLGACSASGVKDEQKQAETEEPAQQSGPQSMQVSDVTDEFVYQGRHYQSTVLRQPDENQPIVTDDAGEEYVDNRISVKLVCDGKVLVDKVFTKQNFAAWVKADFLRQAILEGLVYDTATPEGIVYAASVGYPQTDLYVPFRIVVASDGTLTIRQEELLVDLYETDSAQ